MYYAILREASTFFSDAGPEALNRDLLRDEFFSGILETLAHHLTTDALGLQSFEYVVSQKIGLSVVAASEDIQHQITELWPSMEGNMRLGQQRETGDAMRFKLMKARPQIGESRYLHCISHKIVQKLPGIDFVLIAAVKLHHQVVSVRPRILDQELPFHGPNPPFTNFGRESPPFHATPLFG
jgi:hypothetical protein